MKKYALLSVLLSVAFNPVQAEPAPVKDLGGASSQRITLLEQRFEQSSRQQLQTQQSLVALQNEVDQLRGLLETQNNQLEQMLQRQRELYAELDRRLASGPPSSSTATTPAVGDASAALSETAAYDKAVNLVLKDKQYDQAIPAFYDFINQYPASDLTPNARYWLGQLLFNKSQRKEANAQFEAVVNQFPNSPKRADAMLKMAMIAQLDNNTASAKKLYGRVIKEYPDSPSAQIARTKLSSLK
jgi:tol-pal system protein YbgF